MEWIFTRLPLWWRIPSPPTVRHVIYGLFLGFSLSLTSTSIALFFQRRKQERIAAQFEARPIELRSDEVLKGVTGLIGACHKVFSTLISTDPMGRKYAVGQNQFPEQRVGYRDIRKG